MFRGNDPPVFDEAVFDNAIFDCEGIDQNPGRIIRPLPLKPYMKRPRRR